ncbi:MAG: CPBP family glutamic-type intramembrane protease [Actinomycetes bacterium]
MTHPALAPAATDAPPGYAPPGYAPSAAYTRGWAELVARVAGSPEGARAYATVAGQGGRKRATLRGRERKGQRQLLVGESWFASPWLEAAAAEQAVLLHTPSRTSLRLAALLRSLAAVAAGVTVALAFLAAGGGVAGVVAALVSVVVTLALRWGATRVQLPVVLSGADGAADLVGREAVLGLHTALDSTQARSAAVFARAGLELPAMAPLLRERWGLQLPESGAPPEAAASEVVAADAGHEATADPAGDATAETGSRLSPRRAYGAVLGLYALTFGGAVVTAGLFLSDATLADNSDAGYTWQPMVASAVQQLSADLLVVVAALLIAQRLGLSRLALGATLPRTRRALRGDVLGFVVTIVSFGISSGLMSAVDSRGYPGQDGGPWLVLPMFTSSLMAGPTEELVCLALLVSALRLARQPWLRILALGLVLRLAFHIYYGWPAVFLAVWALSVLLCYAATRRAIGLIVAHSLIDITVTISQLDERTSNAILGFELLLLVAAVIAVGLRMSAYRADELRVALHPVMPPAAGEASTAADYSVAASSGSSTASG